MCFVLVEVVYVFRFVVMISIGFGSRNLVGKVSVS